MQTKKEALEGDVRIEKCWEGSSIVTHVFTNGEWEPTGLKCPPKPPYKIES